MSTGTANTGLRMAMVSLAAIGVWACASAPAPPLLAQADPGSLACASTRLETAGYDVGRASQEVVGEIRVMAGEVGVTREFVTARLAEGGDVLEVRATAYRLDPAMHSLPVDRQMASSVVPGSETTGLAEDIARECAAAR